MDMMDIRRQMMGVIAQMASGGLPVGIKALTTGIATIDSIVDRFTVTTNLGYRPDFFLIKIEIDDYTKIPNGAVVDELFIRMNYENCQSYSEGQYAFRYDSKHITSGNLLSGNYTPPASTNFGDNDTFIVQRGGTSWYPNDTDGNPLQYRWVAIKFDD